MEGNINKQERQHRAHLEGEESLTEMTGEDLANNARVIDPTSNSSVQVRYDSAADEIPPDEYRCMMCLLNDKQREIVMFHRSWCKSTLIASRNDRPIKPYRVFMSGPGDVGKSHTSCTSKDINVLRSRVVTPIIL